MLAGFDHLQATEGPSTVGCAYDGRQESLEQMAANRVVLVATVLDGFLSDAVLRCRHRAAATAVRQRRPAWWRRRFAPEVLRRLSYDVAEANADLSNLPTNGGRAKCMLVWPIEGKKKFETLCTCLFLIEQQLIKQVEYLIRSGWIPCLEFCKEGFVSRKYHASPGYYDGRILDDVEAADVLVH
ncbi:Ribulose bisphosphate carboxylase small chain, chloroplastic [Apostasia shenzhenica]|uniref:Ribulose bisphosphate carboxylase small chain, chloroplastic n=1 Tax=Apostasia shenzhenica TaxID=1088818 RepID=A0A2I0BA14_9ASPA|nr:Ribulose bisphosphate carboxylase small chain, chloroplastic [Apostasia shenzhenica]